MDNRPEGNLDFQELQQYVSICLDEIIKLKEENRKLRNDINEIVQASMQSVQNNKVFMENNNKILENIMLKQNILEVSMDNIRYEVADPSFDHALLYFPSFFSIEVTLDKLINNRASMARFGDGEFAIMTNKHRQAFQHLDDELAKRLIEVIKVKDDNFLVGIADNYGSLEKYNIDGKRGIRYYMTDEIRRDHAQFLDVNRKYHNAYISRPYALFADNNTDAPHKRFDALKKVWECRKVIFVEGSKTRLGVGNDLFDNAASIRRIIAPPVNSFDKYDDILAAALHYGQSDTLFLIALGPSAGILAYDLYSNGFQAIDIGHLDLEYEYFKQGKGGRCEVRNKYNNEFPGGNEVDDIFDEEYNDEIIAKII